MPDSSEGISFPNDVSSTTLLDTPNATSTPELPTNPYDIDAANERFDEAFARFAADQASEEASAALTVAATELNTALGQSGHSWTLPSRVLGRVWKSRRHWLTDVESYLGGSGLDECRRVRLSPKTCLAIARVCALLADSSTGRSLTASNRTIGRLAALDLGREEPFCHDVVSTARRVLAAGGFATETAKGRYLTAKERILAEAHHGCKQIRAASVWALISPRRSKGNSYLPPRGSTPRVYFSCRTSPTRARKRTRAPFGQLYKENRPLGAQIVAAQLVNRAPSLGTKHIGAIVDVIVDTVDYTRWTGRDLVELMNVDARRRAVDWPATIEKPSAFLRYRLRLLSTELAGTSPSEVAAAHAARVRAEQDARRQERQAAQERTASPESVKSHMAAIRATLASRARARNH